MKTIVSAIEDIPKSHLGLARLLFGFEIHSAAYDPSEPPDATHMRLWKALESQYIDAKGKPLRPMEGALWAIIHCFFPTENVPNIRSILDLSKDIEMALVRAGVIKRGGQIESFDLSRKLFANYPRVCISLFKMPNDESI